MTDEIQNIILTQLRAMRDDIAEIKNRFSNVETGQGLIVQHIGHISNQVAQVQVALDKQSVRIGRIEDRLALVDAP
jgi:methyl-accepting chemotaxis protein